MENHQFHTSWWEKRPACHLKAKRIRYSYSLPPLKLRPSHITQSWLIIAAIDGSRARDTKKQEQWETRCVQSRSSNAHSGGCGLQREWAAAARFLISHRVAQQCPDASVLWCFGGFGKESIDILCFSSLSDFDSLVPTVILWITQHHLNQVFCYLI